MYGMIHCAIRQMAVEFAGPEAWRKIEAAAQAGPQDMISALVYDDAVTIRILSGVADGLGIPLGECLERFGRFWLKFTDAGAYAETLRMLGDDVVSFITHLDQMHSAVLAAMPDARVPSFAVTEASDGRLLVRYRSEREGLEPFVIGLLHGVLDRFGLEGEVALRPGNNTGTLFEINYRQAEPAP